jgi:predicted RNA-binding protein YlqC (UPF0109 family)
MTEVVTMKALVEFLVKSLVDHPEEISVAETQKDNGITLELTVAPDDLGKIIGKHGNTVNAIRSVLQAAAASKKQRAKLDVLGSNGLPPVANHDNIA